MIMVYLTAYCSLWPLDGFFVGLSLWLPAFPAFTQTFSLSPVGFLNFVDLKMSTQKILINFAEFKKLKEIEKRYYELQTQLSGTF